jgi:hypothetical protein
MFEKFRISKIKHRTHILCVFCLFILFYSCKNDNNPVSPKIEELPKYSKTLSGSIQLENQTEHGNALIYIDSLDIGTSSDSSGYFDFQFTDEDTVYSGIFTIYYYLADYDLDSAKFALQKGQVIDDSLDVGSEGKLLSKQLKQLMLVDGITDKYEFAVGDTIIFTARITNFSESTIYIRIFNGIQVLANVSLYNDKYLSFPLTPIVYVPSEAYLTLYKNDHYEETSLFIVPEGRYLSDSLYHIPGDEYIIGAGAFELIRTGNPMVKSPLQKRIEKYLRFKWYKNKLPVHHSPELDLFPNKYEFPHIFINN